MAKKDYKTIAGSAVAGAALSLCLTSGSIASGLRFDTLSENMLQCGQEGALHQIFLGADADFYEAFPEYEGVTLDASAPQELKDEWSKIYRLNSQSALEQLRLDAEILVGLA